MHLTLQSPLGPSSRSALHSVGLNIKLVAATTSNTSDDWLEGEVLAAFSASFAGLLDEEGALPLRLAGTWSARQRTLSGWT